MIATSATTDLATLAPRLRVVVTRLNRRLRFERPRTGLAGPASALAMIDRLGSPALNTLAAAEQVRPPSMTRSWTRSSPRASSSAGSTRPIAGVRGCRSRPGAGASSPPSAVARRRTSSSGSRRCPTPSASRWPVPSRSLNASQRTHEVRPPRVEPDVPVLVRSQLPPVLHRPASRSPAPGCSRSRRATWSCGC